MQDYFVQLIATGIVLVLYPICRFLSAKIVSNSGRIFQIQEARILKTRHLVRILINWTFILTVAIIWGVKGENLMLVISSVFAVIGVAFFAQWSLLSNVTASLILFFYAPFRVGDCIEFLDKDFHIVAVIEEIKAFYTHIRTEEGDKIVIPNNLFLQKMVGVKKSH